MKSRPVKLDISNIFDVKTNRDAKNLPDVNLDHWSKMVGAYNSITFDKHPIPSIFSHCALRVIGEILIPNN